MQVIFFSKCRKFYVDFENSIEVPENADGFEDNCLWTLCKNFCQFQQEHMWSAVNVLKSGPKISGPTKGHDTQLNLFNINGTLA